MACLSALQTGTHDTGDMPSLHVHACEVTPAHTPVSQSSACHMHFVSPDLLFLWNAKIQE